jgi:hypothetical protein
VDAKCERLVGIVLAEVVEGQYREVNDRNTKNVASL